jgi:hypothetical protein
MRNKRRDKRLPYINPLSILNSSIGLSLTRIEAKAKLIHSIFHFLHYAENLIFKIRFLLLTPLKNLVTPQIDQNTLKIN